MTKNQTTYSAVEEEAVSLTNPIAVAIWSSFFTLTVCKVSGALLLPWSVVLAPVWLPLCVSLPSTLLYFIIFSRRPGEPHV